MMGPRVGFWEPCAFIDYCLDEKARHKTHSVATELGDREKDGSW